MSDLISRSEVIDLLYKTFDEYKIATDKTSTLGGFGSEVFKRVSEVPNVYDLNEVFDELKELKAYAVYEDINADTKWLDKAIEIVKHGGVSDDVCEWEKGFSGYVGYPAYYSKCCATKSKGLEMQTHIIADWKFCPYCGKKIKIVGD